MKLQDPAGLSCSFCTKAHAEVKKTMVRLDYEFAATGIGARAKKRKGTKKR